MSITFLKFWLSTAIASVGGFFTVFALPWLTLELTDSPLILSSVMACLSLPHSIFMLCGGSLSDKYGPLKVLLSARCLFFVSLSILCGLIFTESLMIWHLYFIALALGSFGAVAAASAQAIPPFLVSQDKLHLANGALMGTNQSAQIIGPILAAFLIYFAKNNWLNGITNVEVKSVGIALLVDLVGILISVGLILKLKVRSFNYAQSGSIFSSLKQGIIWCYSDKAITVVLAYLAFASLLIHGPLAISMPLLAKHHFTSGVTDYGQLYSFMGVGALLGSILAMKFKIRSSVLIMAVMIADFCSGLMILGIANSQSVVTASVYICCIGLALGFISVSGITWFQKRTPEQYMGRVMSLLLFSVFGLTPISTAISGLLIDQTSTQLLLTGSGILLSSIALIGLLIPNIRHISNTPPQPAL